MKNNCTSLFFSLVALIVICIYPLSSLSQLTNKSDIEGIDIDTARNMAQKSIFKICESGVKTCSLDLLTGPNEKAQENGWFFEWTYQGNPRYMFGVYINKYGESTIYGGDPDDPLSAAYEKKQN